MVSCGSSQTIPSTYTGNFWRRKDLWSLRWRRTFPFWTLTGRQAGRQAVTAPWGSVCDLSPKGRTHQQRISFRNDFKGSGTAGREHWGQWALPEWLLKASLNDQSFSPTINMPLLFKGAFPFALIVAILLWYFKNHPSLWCLGDLLCYSLQKGKEGREGTGVYWAPSTWHQEWALAKY